jgi:hypothetical protein
VAVEVAGLGPLYEIPGDQISRDLFRMIAGASRWSRHVPVVWRCGVHGNVPHEVARLRHLVAFPGEDVDDGRPRQGCRHDASPPVPEHVTPGDDIAAIVWFGSLRLWGLRIGDTLRHVPILRKRRVPSPDASLAPRFVMSRLVSSSAADDATLDET